MKSSKRALAAVALLWLAGCASTGGGRVDARLPAATTIDKVAVVSVAGGKFYRAYTGMTVFNNAQEVREIADWGLDRQFAEAARKTLLKLNLNAVEVDEAPSGFLALNGARPSAGGNWAAIEAVAQSYCAARGVDTLLVIGEAQIGDHLTEGTGGASAYAGMGAGGLAFFAAQGSNQGFGGVGVYGRGPAAPTARLHIVSQVGWINCQSGKLMANSLVSVFPESGYLTQARTVPMSAASVVVAEQPMSAWSADQWQYFRATVSKMLAGPLEVTLRYTLNRP